MSGRHLDIAALIDIAEGTRPMPLHAETCDACRRQLADLRTAMTAVVEVEVPEPSPLFWDHLSARIQEAVGMEPPRRSGIWDAWWWPAASVGAVVAVAVVAIAFGVSRLRPSEVGESEPAAAAAVEAGALSGRVGVEAVDGASRLEPAQASDPSLDLIADLSEGLGWEAATAAGWTTATASLEDAFDQLNDTERATLQQLLQEALSGKGA